MKLTEIAEHAWQFKFRCPSIKRHGVDARTVDMNVTRLHLFLRFSHGFVNKKNAVLAPFKHILLDLIVLPATDESLCTTGPLFQTLHFSLDKTIEGTSIYIFYDLSPYPPYPQTP